MSAPSAQGRSPESQQNLTLQSDNPRRDVSRSGYYSPLSPYSMLQRFSEEMDRVFGGGFGLFRDRGESGSWSPAIDVHERNGNLEVTAELPGAKKEDIKVECTDEGLTIEGERRQERQENQGGFHRSERSYGRFYRMIPLPPGAKTDQAKAEFKDGLLQVRIPIPDTKRGGRQIPIAS